MKIERYRELRQIIGGSDFGGEIEWSENIRPPASPEAFGREAIYIICNSGMRYTVARKIYDTLIPIVMRGGSASRTFGHKGKAEAIDWIWAERNRLYEEFMACETDDDALAYLLTLPWIGNITKYHLAKNLGVDCAKPDRWLVRLSEHFGTDTHSLCRRLAEESGDRVATVDLVLWRAAERGLLNELSA